MASKSLFKRPKRGFSVLNVDANPDQQDWIKRGSWDGDTTLDAFWTRLGLTSDSTKTDKRKALRHFRTLPAFERIPAGIKSALVKQGLI